MKDPLPSDLAACICDIKAKLSQCAGLPVGSYNNPTGDVAEGQRVYLNGKYPAAVLAVFDLDTALVSTKVNGRLTLAVEDVSDMRPAGGYRLGLGMILEVLLSSDYSIAAQHLMAYRLIPFFLGDEGRDYINVNAAAWALAAFEHLHHASHFEEPGLLQEVQRLRAFANRDYPWPGPESISLQPINVDSVAEDGFIGSLYAAAKLGSDLLKSAITIGETQFKQAINECKGNSEIEGLGLGQVVHYLGESLIICTKQKHPGFYVGYNIRTGMISQVFIGGDCSPDNSVSPEETMRTLEHLYILDGTLTLEICDAVLALGIKIGGSAAVRAALMAGTIYREMPLASERKHAMRAMTAAYKAMPLEDRKSIASVLPELVNPRAKKELLSLGNSHRLFELYKQELAKAYPESFEPDISVGAESRFNPKPDSQAHQILPTTPVLPSAPTIKPIKFHVNENVLIAMEWSLPEQDISFQLLKQASLHWLRTRFLIDIPDLAPDGYREYTAGGVRLSTEATHHLFAFRLEHPDVSTPGRTWRMEVSALPGPEGKGGMVGLRLSALDTHTSASPTTGIPSLVRMWMAEPGLVVGEGLAGVGTPVQYAQDFFALRNLIEDPARDYPVWVIDSKTIFEPNSQLAPLVTWYTLASDQVRSDYTKRISAPNAVSQQGGFDVFPQGSTTPTHYNLESPETLDALRREAFIMRQSPGTPGFADVRAALAAAAHVPVEAAPPSKPVDRKSAESVEDKPEHAAQRQDVSALLQMAIGEQAAQAQELARALETIRSLKAQLHARGYNDSCNSEPPDQDAYRAIPETLAEIGSWSASLSQRLSIADKAIKVASKTDHKEVGKIYRILLALHDYYWEMRWGSDPEAKVRWVEFLQANRLRCGLIGAAALSTRFGDSYQAVFDNKVIGMTLHVQGSSTRDPLRCIRVYFHPDDDAQQIRIGSLPKHLDNTLS